MKKLLLFFVLATVFALNGQADDELYYVDQNMLSYKLDPSTKTATVAGATNATGEITVPSSITMGGDDYAVIAIGENINGGGVLVFTYSTVTSLTISEGIKEICNNALTCETLEKVVLPQSLTTIGKYAFNGCTSLKSIEIPDGVTTIDILAFLGCTNLESASISKTVTSIAGNVFSKCPNLKKITVAEDNSVYDSRNNCNAIIVSKTNELISGCQNTVIPNDVTKLGDGAYSGCSFTTFEIPVHINELGTGVFENCSALTNITIPKSITCIPRNTFFLCESLSSYTIPEGITEIGDFAFSLAGLTSISIPTSVTTIGEMIFALCNALTTVTAYNQDPQPINEKSFMTYDLADWNNVFPIDATLYVPKGTKAKYEAADGWKNFKEIIEMDGETGIENIMNTEQSAIDYYNLSGHKTSTPNKGLNIIKMSDGRVRKVVVK